MTVPIEQLTKKQLLRVLDTRINVTGKETKRTLLCVAKLIGLKGIRVKHFKEFLT
jgi:hypothetical protein